MYTNQMIIPQAYSNQFGYYGGYPNMGYPPQMPQTISVSQNGYEIYPPTADAMNSQHSPFMNPPVSDIQSQGLPQPYWDQNSQMNMMQSQTVPFRYVPGANGPIEAHRPDGTVEYINMNRGGTTVSSGGFNPVTQTNTPQASQIGYTNNPYMRFQGQYLPQQNAGYGYQYGYSPFPTYGQNQFDREISEILYNEDTSFYDPMGALEEILLTDEEREAVNRNRQIQFSGYDYYGRPIYNTYGANVKAQEAFNTARKNVQTYFTKLSKICHAYFGEDINEDEMMKRFDPIKEAPKPAQLTPQEVEYRRQIQWVEYCNDLDKRLAQEDQMEYGRRLLKLQYYQKIRDSHTKMLGVQPGESYDLNTFMNNGYKILAHDFVENGRRRLKDASKKYDSKAFRSSIAINTNKPVPIKSKDDEYIQIEERLRRVYEKNKSSAMMALPDGSFAFGIAPPGQDQETYRQRLFAEAIERKRQRDAAARSIGC